MNIKYCTTKEQMLENYEVISELYGKEFTKVQYSELLDEILKGEYQQIGIYEENQCIAVTGIWTGTKLWCGKYVEIDNFVVSEKKRGQKIGKILIDEVKKYSKSIKAKQIALDAFTVNFGAMKFYLNQGFLPKGFHYIIWV
jgi:GNAT superfamily N-acetyltransferase